MVLILPFLLLFSQGIEPLKKELEHGEKLLKKKEEEYQRITKDLEDLLNSKDRIQQTLRELDRKNQELEKKQRDLQDEIARKEKILTQRRNSLTRSLALGYSLFAGGILERMIRWGDPKEEVRIRGGVRVASERVLFSLKKNQELIASLRQDLKALEDLSGEIRRNREELLRKHEELERLEIHLRERISVLKSEIEFRRRYVQEIRTELRKLLEELGPEIPGTSSLAIIPPVDAPLLLPYGRVKDPLFGVEIFHPGWTYRVPVGTPVRASAGGELFFYGWVRGYGNLLILKHPGGFYTLYGHLERTHLHPGDRVDQGDTIAQSGDSGSLYGPALQFEVRKGKNPVNPALFLKRR